MKNLVQRLLPDMDSVRDFVRGIHQSIPDDAGKDGQGGMMIVPHCLPNPDRKRR